MAGCSKAPADVVFSDLGLDNFLDGLTREEAIERAVKSLTTGREGLVVLLTNRPLTASHTLEIYRSRNDIETAFRDLKHGIDRGRPGARRRTPSKDAS